MTNNVLINNKQMKIYVASSWRNKYQQSVVSILRAIGHEVYDFRNPPHGKGGFSWNDIDPNWDKWTTSEYRAALEHPVSVNGFESDFNGMKWADCCVMVLPCGRSAHSEAGWFAGMGLRTYVFSPEKEEPELMYKIYDGIFATIGELADAFTDENLLTYGNKRNSPVKRASKRAKAKKEVLDSEEKPEEAEAREGSE